MADSITVIISTHGRPVLLRRTLDSLAACALPDGYTETVVVENGSRAGAEAVVAEVAVEHPALRRRYMHVERTNKSYTLNEALATVAPAALAVLLDDGLMIELQTLETYATAAVECREGAYFGGPLRVHQEQSPPAWLEPILPASALGWDRRKETQRARGFLCANWPTYVSEIQAAGGFDPDHGPGSPRNASGQETTMQQPLRTIGAPTVTVMDARGWHSVPATGMKLRWALRRKYRAGIEAGVGSARWETRRILNEVRKTGRIFGRFAYRIGTEDRARRVSALADVVKQVGILRCAP